MSAEVARRALLKGIFASLMVGMPTSLLGCGDDSAASPAATDSDAAAPTAASSDDPTVYETYMSDTDSARIIAQRYLAQVAPSTTMDQLRSLVAPTMAVATATADVPTNVAALRAQVLADFGNGQSLNIDGWQLSITELQLCVIESTPDLAT